MQKEHQVPIWFFIGLILTAYGVLIFGAGIYGLFHPPERIALSNLHAGIWWGALLLVLGITYSVKFRPSKTAPRPAPEDKSNKKSAS